MNHIIKPMDGTTARIAFEFNKGFRNWRKLAIGRIYFFGSSRLVICRGALLGRDPGKPSALILDVRKRDLISVMERSACDGNFTWRFYRIGHNFEPEPLDLPSDSFRLDDLRDHIELSDLNPDVQVDCCDNLLKDFLAEPHPDWLAEILDRQIQHWRAHHPERFYRLAPSRSTEQEFYDCCQKFPLLTLGNFQDRLSTEDVYWLAQRSLKGAVMHAFHVLTDAQIKKAIDEHPGEMIRHAAAKLTDRQLRTCIHKEPQVAFHCRWTLPSRRRAAVLAIAYPGCFLHYHDNPGRALHWEVIASITKHSDVWLSIHKHKGFEAVFDGLRRYLGMKVDSRALWEMFGGMDSEIRPLLSRYIAKYI
jgi:hypothetical protein